MARAVQQALQALALALQLLVVALKQAVGGLRDTAAESITILCKHAAIVHPPGSPRARPGAAVCGQRRQQRPWRHRKRRQPWRPRHQRLSWHRCPRHRSHMLRLANARLLARAHQLPAKCMALWLGQPMQHCLRTKRKGVAAPSTGRACAGWPPARAPPGSGTCMHGQHLAMQNVFALQAATNCRTGHLRRSSSWRRASTQASARCRVALCSAPSTPCPGHNGRDSFRGCGVPSWDAAGHLNLALNACSERVPAWEAVGYECKALCNLGGIMLLAALCVC